MIRRICDISVLQWALDVLDIGCSICCFLLSFRNGLDIVQSALLRIMPDSEGTVKQPQLQLVP